MIQKFYYNDTDTFVVPLGDGNVTLGTCKQYENSREEPDMYDSMSIRSKCEKVCPMVAGAPVVDQWVGLRPHRHILRLEIERLGKLKVFNT